MKESELRQIRKDCDKRKQEIENEYTKAREEYLSKSPFKSGDKVLVTFKHGSPKQTLFIRSVSPWSDEIPYFYRFQKMKKDGTMSRHIYDMGYEEYDTITKLS